MAKENDVNVRVVGFVVNWSTVARSVDAEIPIDGGVALKPLGTGFINVHLRLKLVASEYNLKDVNRLFASQRPLIFDISEASEGDLLAQSVTDRILKT